MIDIPTSIATIAKSVVPKPVSDFSELISLKLFGKSIAKLKAEIENTSEEVKLQGQIKREVARPFLVEIETARAYREYSNLGITMQKASQYILSAPTGKINDDNDVFWGLLEHSKHISNNEMQELIAKIIAGEYNNPETYSMSTLQVLKSLGKKEIELFEKVASLLIYGNMLPHHLFTTGMVDKDFMKSIGIHFGSLQTLQNLGLFLPNDMANVIPNPENKKYQVIYFNEKITFESENENKDIHIPNYYGLSEAGLQILQHLKPRKVEGYLDWLKGNYAIPNYRIIP